MRFPRDILLVRYLGCVVASAAGRNAYFVIVAWLAVDSSNSPSTVAILLAVGSVAEFLTTNLGGFIVDRFDRRLTCLICDGLRLAIMAGTAVGLAFAKPVPVLLFSWVAYAVVDRTYLTALQALIPSLVNPHRLLSFNSWSYLVMQFGNLAAALAAGALLVAIPQRYCLFGPMACFLVSFLGMSTGTWKPRLQRAKLSIAMAARGLLPTMLPRGPLFTAAMIYSLIYAMGMLVSVLGSALIQREINSSALAFGYIEAAWAAGSVAGCVTLLLRSGRPNALVFHLLLAGSFLALFLMVQNLPTALIQMVMLGASYNIARVLVDVQVQQSVSVELLGRARSQIHTVCVGVGLLIYTLVAIIGDKTSPSLIFGVFGVVMIIGAIIIFLRTSRKQSAGRLA